MVSQECELHIDRQSRTGRISYRGVRAHQEDLQKLGQVLERLDTLEAFGEKAQGIELKMSMLRSQEGELGVEVFFEHEGDEAIAELFDIEPSEDGGVSFEPGDQEKVLSTNGKRRKGKIRWGADQKKLHLELSGKPLEKSEREGMVVVKYLVKED